MKYAHLGTDIERHLLRALGCDLYLRVPSFIGGWVVCHETRTVFGEGVAVDVALGLKLPRLLVHSAIVADLRRQT